MIRYHDDPIEEADSGAPRNKFWSIVLAIFMISFGSTYAANISINTGQPSEFGQGIQVTSGCDANIYINTTAGFTNSSGASNSAFGVETVTVSDIAASCVGKSFKLNLFDSTTSASLNASPIIISYAASPTNGQTFNGSTWSSSAADIKVSGATLVRATIDTTNSGLDSRAGKTTLSIAGITTSGSAKVQSANVSRVSLESTAYIGIYAIGDAGPGGGTIFMTPSTAGNNSGKYFEFAPVDVETSIGWGSNYSGVSDSTGAARLAIGAGQANTAEIIAKSTGPGGARSAAAYTNNGYSDWFLGSGYEVNALCMYARGTISTRNPATQNCNTGSLSGTWSNEYITSSVRGYDGYMWRIIFTGYGIDFNHPAGAVRPIRMFAPGS
jgi:hypothetical protein